MDEMWTKAETERKKTPEPRFGSLENQGKNLILELFACLFNRNSNGYMSSGMTGTVAYYCKAEIDYLDASSIATATATVIPTMGLLPAPIRPIIST